MFFNFICIKDYFKKESVVLTLEKGEVSIGNTIDYGSATLVPIGLLREIFFGIISL